MRNALILTVLAISAFVHSTAAYWTVRYRSEKLDYNWYWAEYELWEADLSKNISMGYTTQDLLFGDNGGSWGGCQGTDQVSAFGTKTELHSLHVYKSTKVFNCALMEVQTDYKTYICGDSLPPVPSAVTSSATTATATAIVAPTSVAVNTATTITITTTKAPTTTAAPTCIAGYRGKHNGKGPNGACCSHSDDCKDTCVKSICGVSP